MRISSVVPMNTGLHTWFGMSACPPSCRCWPRQGQAFTLDEQRFLAAVTDDRSASTKQVLALAEAMVGRVGWDRAGYLLSVPVNFRGQGGFLVWPAIRLSDTWTPRAKDATALLRLLVQCGACLACPMYEDVGRRVCRWTKGWLRGMEEHPGRYQSDEVPWSTAMGATPHTRLLAKEWAWLAPQIRRWDARSGKRLWLAL
jgi:hypothetical protein